MSNSSFNSNYISVSGGSGGSNSIQDFRLTLASNTPVMTSQVLAATTLYLTPYVGNKIALYNGSSSWNIITSSQVSLSLSGFTADTNYDIFAYNNSGTVTLEALAWSNSGAGTSTRTTALEYQDGVLVKSGATTRRYIGTIRTTGTTGQCQFSFGGQSATATEAKLFVFNYYNQVDVAAFVAIGDGSNSAYTYSQGSPSVYLFRAAGGNNSYRVSFICGMPENDVSARYDGVYGAITSGSGSAGIAIGHNTTSSCKSSSFFIGAANSYVSLGCSAEILPSAGFNYVSALDVASGGIVATYYYSGYFSNGGEARVWGLCFRGKF